MASGPFHSFYRTTATQPSYASLKVVGGTTYGGAADDYHSHQHYHLPPSQSQTQNLPSQTQNTLSTSSPSARQHEQQQQPQQQQQQQQQQQHQRASADPVEEDIVIRVCDESRNMTKNFTCKKSLLIARMRYFRNYLTANSAYDIDISVHCDVQIFEWLMRYIHQPDQPPPLEVWSVVSILISSEFLEMEDLIDLCLRFMSEHLNEILRIPLDFSCLTDKVVRKLARLTTPLILSTVKDRKDRLLSKLYRRRIEADFAVSDGEGSHGPGSNKTAVRCCEHCGLLFPDGARGKLRCAKAAHVVDFRGRSLQFHKPIVGWKLHEHLGVLRTRGLSWQDLYWMLWGRTKYCRCRVCGEVYLLGEIDECRSHADPPVFLEGNFKGHFPCCAAAVPRFNLNPREPPGCRVRDHVLDAAKVGEFAAGMLQNRRHWVLAVAWKEVLMEEANKTLAALAAAGNDDGGDGSSSGGEEDDDDESVRSGAGGGGHGGAMARRRAPSSSSPQPQQPSSRRRGGSSYQHGSVSGGSGGGMSGSTRPGSRLLPSRNSTSRRGAAQQQQDAESGAESEDEAPARGGRGQAAAGGGPGSRARQQQTTQGGQSTRARQAAATKPGKAARDSSRPPAGANAGTGGASTLMQQPLRGAVTAVELVSSSWGNGNGRGKRVMTDEEKALVDAFAVFKALPIAPRGKLAACIEDVMPGGHPLQALPRSAAQVSEAIKEARMSPGHRREWWLDSQRDQDAERMRHLCKRLMRLRASGAGVEEAGGEQHRAGPVSSSRVQRRSSSNAGESSSSRRDSSMRPDSRGSGEAARTAIGEGRRSRMWSSAAATAAGTTAATTRAQTAERSRRETR